MSDAYPTASTGGSNVFYTDTNPAITGNPITWESSGGTIQPKTIGVIIQARLTSKRFPNKVLCPINGKPVLQWTIEAVKKSGYNFVITIPRNKTSQGLRSWLKLYDNSIKVYSGSEEDLIESFRIVNESEKFDTIVRICADSPMMNYEDIQLAIDLYHKRGKYSRVNLVEVFSNIELEYANENDPFISRRNDCVNILNQTVDYPEDIERIENEIRRMG